MDDELMTDLLAAVEQQLESPHTRYVAETWRRLCAAGTAEDDAKRAIAQVLGDLSDQMLENRAPFDVAAYKQALAGLG